MISFLDALLNSEARSNNFHEPMQKTKFLKKNTPGDSINQRQR